MVTIRQMLWMVSKFLAKSILSDETRLRQMRINSAGAFS